MTRCLQLLDLDQPPLKPLIQYLTLKWVQVQLPPVGLSYADFVSAIRLLLLTVQDPDRTAIIVEAVLRQAKALGKTSAWVEREFKFEAMIEGADRVDFLRLDLQQSTLIDDTTLDSYNERLNRFGDQIA